MDKKSSYLCNVTFFYESRGLSKNIKRPGNMSSSQKVTKRVLMLDIRSYFLHFDRSPDSPHNWFLVSFYEDDMSPFPSKIYLYSWLWLYPGPDDGPLHAADQLWAA